MEESNKVPNQNSANDDFQLDESEDTKSQGVDLSKKKLSQEINTSIEDESKKKSEAEEQSEKEGDIEEGDSEESEKIKPTTKTVTKTNPTSKSDENSESEEAADEGESNKADNEKAEKPEEGENTSLELPEPMDVESEELAAEEVGPDTSAEKKSEKTSGPETSDKEPMNSDEVDKDGVQEDESEKVQYKALEEEKDIHQEVDADTAEKATSDPPVTEPNVEIEEDEENEEETHYKDNVGFKDGVSMLDHLKQKFRQSAQADTSQKVKAVEKSNVVKEPTAEVKKPLEEEDVAKEEEFTTKSYRVVIALKRPPAFLRRSDLLISRDIMHKTRIIILEFALTPKSSTSKKIFSAAMEGPLREVAHGGVWPEIGPLSFKHTVTKVLSEMHLAREKEKRLASAEAMYIENQGLKKKCKGYEGKLKDLEEEVLLLKKKIKKAKSCLT